uniref:Uncharacterized protein n=1 Tax=Aegilops tauschii subsp. strangulata TaxID=200361 RepID=A0A452Z2Q5_AEGTS
PTCLTHRRSGHDPAAVHAVGRRGSAGARAALPHARSTPRAACRGLQQARPRGPVMARTVAATMFVVLGSSGYSIAKIRRREGEFAQLTPTDQVLASRHLLEASLMGILSVPWANY